MTEDLGSLPGGICASAFYPACTCPALSKAPSTTDGSRPAHCDGRNHFLGQVTYSIACASNYRLNGMKLEEGSWRSTCFIFHHNLEKVVSAPLTRHYITRRTILAQISVVHHVLL
jgi:hypothetical protein